MSWTNKELIDVCEIKLGKTPSRNNKRFWDKEKINKNIWVSIADLSKIKTKEIFDTKEYISDLGASLFKPVKTGTLLMSFKLSIGKLAYAGCDLYTNEAIVALPIKNSSILLKEFLFYFLQNYDWDKETENDVKLKGKTLNKEKLKKIKIPLPPLATQQKIVAKLDAIFTEIDRVTAATQANIKNAEALFQSYLTEVFERGDEDWATVKLNDVVKELVTGPFGSSLHKSDYVKSGIPVINPQNLINGKIIPLNKTMVPELIRERLKKYRLKSKDIVIARRGEMGRCGLVDTESEGWICGTGSMIVRLNNKVDENYIFQLLQSNRVKRELESNSIGATMNNLNQSILLNVQFLLPPIEFQIKTNEVIKQLSEKTYYLSQYYLKKIDEQLKFKHSILQQAFNGELVKE